MAQSSEMDVFGYSKTERKLYSCKLYEMYGKDLGSELIIKPLPDFQQILFYL